MGQKRVLAATRYKGGEKWNNFGRFCLLVPGIKVRVVIIVCVQNKIKYIYKYNSLKAGRWNTNRNEHSAKRNLQISLWDSNSKTECLSGAPVWWRRRSVLKPNAHLWHPLTWRFLLQDWAARGCTAAGTAPRPSCTHRSFWTLLRQLTSTNSSSSLTFSPARSAAASSPTGRTSPATAGSASRSATCSARSAASSSTAGTTTRSTCGGPTSHRTRAPGGSSTTWPGSLARVRSLGGDTSNWRRWWRAMWTWGRFFSTTSLRLRPWRPRNHHRHHPTTSKLCDLRRNSRQVGAVAATTTATTTTTTTTPPTPHPRTTSKTVICDVTRVR